MIERPSQGRIGNVLRIIGPGLAIAATGVGAGDLLAAMFAGADFGMALLWVVVVGASLKFGLNEGVARWQLATGTTLLEGWCRHLGWPFKSYFLVYLVLWSFIVAAGLMSACGVAAHALWPVLSITAWGVIHSLAALVLVALGRYGFFESIMKILIGLMTVTLLISVVLVGPDLGLLVRGLVPSLPPGSAAATLSLMGGVGGSVTLLAYGYWIREKGWSDPSMLATVRIDLAVGYVLTGLFGVAILVLAATVLSGGDGMPAGSSGLVACGDAIGEAAAARFGSAPGNAAGVVFLIGVWGAVFTSTLGVWNGVPYLFADFVNALQGRFDAVVDTTGTAYRGYLLYLALPPMALLFLGRPLWIIKVYTLTGGLFMPLLAASLLWLNSRRDLVGRMRNRVSATATLVLALVLFGLIAIRQLMDLG
ncbi:MAG: Nramp family divalent metal transporter [Acidobacteriota bacterium]|nr:Nramp family divalent metal transporter [Acidobacteriota bacterium]